MQTNKTIILFLAVLTISNFSNLSAMHLIRRINPAQISTLQKLIRSERINPTQATQLTSQAIAFQNFQPPRYYAFNHNNINLNQPSEFENLSDRCANLITKFPKNFLYTWEYENYQALISKKGERFDIGGKSINPEHPFSELNYTHNRSYVKKFLLTYQSAYKNELGKFALFHAIIKNDYEMILILLHLGININSTVMLEDGEEVTLISCIKDTRLIKLLKEVGFKID